MTEIRRPAMSARDLWATIRPWRWLIVTITLISLVAVGAILTFRPRIHRAAATAVLPRSEGSARSTEGLVAGFRSLATSEAVSQEVGQKLSVPPDQIRDRTEVEASASSGIITVTFGHPSPEKAEEVAPEIVRTTLARLGTPQVIAAEKLFEIAQDELAEAEAAVAEASRQSGVFELDQQYRAKVGLLGQLEADAASAQSRGLSSAGIRAQIETVRAELAALGPQLLEYQRLTGRRERAAEVLSTAQQRLKEAEALAASFDEAGAVSTARARATPRIAEALRSFAIVGLLALLFTTALVVLLSLLRPAAVAATPDASDVADWPQPNEPPADPGPHPVYDPAPQAYPVTHEPGSATPGTDQPRPVSPSY